MDYIDKEILPSVKPYSDISSSIAQRQNEIQHLAELYIGERNRAMDRSDAAAVNFYSNLLKEVARQMSFLERMGSEAVGRQHEFYRNQRAYYTPKHVYRGRKSKAFKRNY